MVAARFPAQRPLRLVPHVVVESVVALDNVMEIAEEVTDGDH